MRFIVGFVALSLVGCGGESVEVTKRDAWAAVLRSDDFVEHKSAFVDATFELVKDGTCTLDELAEQGGWWKSSDRGEQYYFTYCGGMTLRNKLYLNVQTGQVSR